MKYRRERRKLFRIRFLYLTQTLLAPLLLLSVIFDLLLRPEKWELNISIRLIVMLAAIGLSMMQKSTAILRKVHTLPMHLLTLTLSSAICLIGWSNEYDISVYLLKINMVAIMSFCMMPWTKRGFLTSALTIYGPITTYLFFRPEGTFELFVETEEVAFTVSVAIIGAFINYLNVRDFRSSFEKRLQLLRGGQTKDQMIDEAAVERIHLERLTTQFSPQVIEAIRTGELKLEESSRREITAIFIDIENSSMRSKHLDHAAYEKVLREFFSLVTDVLIKHNITIGTYLGDGLLAFANAPVKSPKHQLLAARACLDLTEVMLERRDYFNEMWRAEFNIRIGINSGHTSVGFYPNARFGSYTALGDAVNLAARLCASAAPNTICMTKDFLKIVGPDLREISAEPNGNMKNLKGFQADDLTTYSVSTTKKKTLKNECPRCSMPLFIRTDLETCVLLNCETCGYSDVREKTTPAEAFPLYPASSISQRRAQ